ncbi:MAG: ATP-binding cassette domain-containing protein, partial [Candidatus Dormibacteraeota bacterium]|nr:ATP-binding cassette domain-containing protein [Candidatus Dormibacteraeota bacterium]
MLRDTGSAALAAHGLRVERAGRCVLDGIAFAVPRATVTGLFGPSGCGKTTLMRSIVGVQRNVRGELSVLGLPAGDARLRRRVAYTTQAPATYADLT